MADVSLIRPTLAQLPAYIDALERGWSPDNVRGADAAREQRHQIKHDISVFLDRLDDPEAKGEPIKLPNGSFVQRLPSVVRWIWDGDFCGSIGFRWQAGTSELPTDVLGHIGFAVVPWKRNLGHAKRALALLLPSARCRGLDYVELTTDLANIASQKVIEACGGKVVEQFKKPSSYGSHEAFRFRIDLTGIQSCDQG